MEAGEISHATWRIDSDPSAGPLPQVNCPGKVDEVKFLVVDGDIGAYTKNDGVLGTGSIFSVCQLAVWWMISLK